MIVDYSVNQYFVIEKKQDSMSYLTKRATISLIFDSGYSDFNDLSSIILPVWSYILEDNIGRPCIGYRVIYLENT